MSVILDSARLDTEARTIEVDLPAELHSDPDAMTVIVAHLRRRGREVWGDRAPTVAGVVDGERDGWVTLRIA